MPVLRVAGLSVGIFLALLGVFIFMIARANGISDRTKAVMKERELDKKKS
jgi:hypothetical protein